MPRSRVKKYLLSYINKILFSKWLPLWTHVENNELLECLFLEGESAIDIHKKLVIVYAIFIIIEVLIVTLKKKRDIHHSSFSARPILLLFILTEKSALQNCERFLESILLTEV